MIQTTEVWFITCDFCGVVSKRYVSKYLAISKLAKQGWDTSKDGYIKCNDCRVV